jgi:hypothetical protein
VPAISFGRDYLRAVRSLGKERVQRWEVTKHKIDFNLILNMRVRTTVRPCGLVARVPGYKCRGPGSSLGATRFSGK